MKKISYLNIVAIVGLFMLHNQVNAYGVNPITKAQIPYVAQAVANMRTGIDSKKKAAAASLTKDSKKIAAPKKARRGMANQVIHLTQRDFDSGTYRIRTPNTTVIFDTDVEFEPRLAAEATRTDKPITGWFAAMTVEADNIIIDMNGKTLQASEFFLAADAENVYANIELDNAPFSGLLFGILGAFFPGDTEFVSANNVIVKNGTLGRSDHWGIHGNSNSNITIQDMRIKDFAVAGIELNGVIDSTVSNVKITGLEHVIRTNFVGVAASTLVKFLVEIANTPDQPCYTGACEQLAGLLAYIEANPELFRAPRFLPQAAFLGIAMASGFLNFTFFPSDPAACDLAALIAGGRNTDNITLENICIDGLHNAPEASVVIASQANGQIISLPLLGIPVFGVLTWDSAFDKNGNFAPTPLLLAQVFVANTQLCLDPEIISQILPPNWDAISESINTGNEELFLTNVFPGFGIALDGVPVKGTFAVRFDCSHKGTLRNVTTSNINNLGQPGATLATIPDGEFYVGLVQEERYQGNDCWGFEFGTQDQGLVQKCHASNISSLNGGEILGFDLITNSMNTTVDACTSNCIVGFADDVNSIVNPPATSYGLRVENNTGAVAVTNSTSKNITAPRFALGFASEETDGVTFTKCTAEQISATSSKDLSSPKQAFGFVLESAKNTILKCVTAKNIAIKGEKDASESASVAAGIGIDSGSDGTVILCPTIKNIDGGAGQADKILDEGTNTVITKGKKCKKICKR
jgi:hypothetical protein